MGYICFDHLVYKVLIYCDDAEFNKVAVEKIIPNIDQPCDYCVNKAQFVVSYYPKKWDVIGKPNMLNTVENRLTTNQMIEPNIVINTSELV